MPEQPPNWFRSPHHFARLFVLAKGAKTVDAKNMMGVLMLGAGKGTTLRLMIEGDDDALAHQAIVDLFNRRFDEGE
jgi:phosphotransferase system HPr (HPr) family protein